MNLEADTIKARHLLEQKLDLERRKRLERKRKNPTSQLHRARVGDLNKVFQANYGIDGRDYVFPDDDSGRIDAAILAQHYANGNPSALARVLRYRLPWMDEAEFQSFIAEAYAEPRFWPAQELAQALQLTDLRRSDLKVKTIGSIDVSKRQRKKRRKVKDKADHAAVRRANGVKPRDEWLAEHTTNKDKPWEAENISRATYFRRLAKANAADTDTSETGLSAMKLVIDNSDTPVSTETTEPAARPLQDMNLAKSRVPIPATYLREAA